MKSEDKQKQQYTRVLNYIYGDRKFLCIAIYKTRRSVYRFVYKYWNADGPESGLYKLTEMGWVEIADVNVIDYFSNTTYPKESEYKTYTDYIENTSTLFFDGCVKFLNFLLSQS